MGYTCNDKLPLSPAAVDELADLLHPETSAAMLATIRSLAEGAAPGPLADAWQLLADALTGAHEIAAFRPHHRGAP